MLTSENEEQIIEFLKKESDECYPIQVKPIVYAVYGANKVNKKNIMFLVREYYSFLCRREKNKGDVRNTNPLPVPSPLAMAASRWYYQKNK